MKLYLVKEEEPFYFNTVGIFSSKEKAIEVLKEVYPQKELIGDYESWEEFCEEESGESITYDEYIEKYYFTDSDCVEEFELDKKYFI